MSGTNGLTEGAEGTEGAPQGTEGTAAPAQPPASVATPPEGTEAGAAGVAPTPEAAPAPAATPTQDWRDRRIKQLTAALHEARGTGKTQEPSGTSEPPVAAPPDPAEFERRVAAEAEARAQLAEFNRACNDVAAKGRSTFGEAEFNGRVAELTKLVNGADVKEVQQYNQFLSAAIETGEAPKLLHQLGGNLNEAARIMALPPVKMAVELAKLALRAGETGKGSGNELSSAPRPITPIGGRNSAAAEISPDDPERADGLPIDVWMKKREAAAEAKAKQRYN